jgi:hypothetical protein
LGGVRSGSGMEIGSGEGAGDGSAHNLFSMFSPPPDTEERPTTPLPPPKKPGRGNALLRRRAHGPEQLKDGVAARRVGDLVIGGNEPGSFGGTQNGGGGYVCLRQHVTGSTARQALKKIGDGNSEKPGEVIKTAGRDAIKSGFVFADLLKGDAAGFREALLTHGDFSAPLP